MTTVQVRFFKLCMYNNLAIVYQFIAVLMILTLFQGHKLQIVEFFFYILVHCTLNIA